MLINSLNEWRALRRTFSDKNIGFVPTMGNLHDGHFSLLKRSKEENDLTILSVFVNPTQFNNPDDLTRYPRTLDADVEGAKALGVDYILVPQANEIYNDDYNYCVHEKNVSRTLEGEHRPGHFDGVLTVVMKLFNLVKPHRAYMGEKDFQQLYLVQEMVNAFFMDIEVIACPSIRYSSGLPLSSRHNLLSSSQLSKAQELTSLLQACPTLEDMKALLTQQGLTFDYVTQWKDRIVVAFHFEGIRLIDNWRI